MKGGKIGTKNTTSFRVGAEIEAVWIPHIVPCQSCFKYRINSGDLITEGQLNSWWQQKLEGVKSHAQARYGKGGRPLYQGGEES